MAAQSDLPRAASDLLELCRTILMLRLQDLERGVAKVRIPRPGTDRRTLKGEHYHHTPELFFQVAGISEFRCPREHFRLHPGEICIVPRGVPHREKAVREKGSFSNIVIMCQQKSISFHEAQEMKGTPSVGELKHFVTARQSRIMGYIDDIVEWQWIDTVEARSVLRGLLLLLLSELLSILNHVEPLTVSGHPKIVQTRNLITANMSAPTLSVKVLAAWMGCSADYLSFLFHKETGERLSRFINNERIAHAKTILENSSFSIAEVAWSCGYEDPAYFTRLFHRTCGSTPREFRRKSAPADGTHE